MTIVSRTLVVKSKNYLTFILADYSQFDHKVHQARFYQTSASRVVENKRESYRDGGVPTYISNCVKESAKPDLLIRGKTYLQECLVYV